MFDNIDFDSDGERAVSPVIGVILMVAITVILAAVIGTFVLGLGDQVSNTTPQASLSVDDVQVGGNATAGELNDSIVLRHEGGDTISSEDTTLSVTGDAVSNETTLNPTDASASGSISTTNTLNITSRHHDDSGTTGTTTIWDGQRVSYGDIDPIQLIGDETGTVTLVDEGSGQILAEKEFST